MNILPTRKYRIRYQQVLCYFWISYDVKKTDQNIRLTKALRFIWHQHVQHELMWDTFQRFDPLSFMKNLTLYWVLEIPLTLSLIQFFILYEYQIGMCFETT